MPSSEQHLEQHYDDFASLEMSGNNDDGRLFESSKFHVPEALQPAAAATAEVPTLLLQPAAVAAAAPAVMMTATAAAVSAAAVGATGLLLVPIIDDNGQPSLLGSTPSDSGVLYSQTPSYPPAVAYNNHRQPQQMQMPHYQQQW
jgi:hypothetical protein